MLFRSAVCAGRDFFSDRLTVFYLYLAGKRNTIRHVPAFFDDLGNAFVFFDRVAAYVRDVNFTLDLAANAG